jgi:hypothetical protein
MRSQETVQKEHDLQALYTKRINLAIESGGDPGYGEKLQDFAVFANVLRKNAPENCMVVLHERPEILLISEGSDYEVTLYINSKMWRFKVNGSVHYVLPEEQTFGATRALKKMWDCAISQLPENFIIRGKIDRNDPEEETVARTKLQQTLGFSFPQIDDSVYGIVRDKKLHPLTLEEFRTLTEITPDHLSQKFDVRKINWPGA